MASVAAFRGRERHGVVKAAARKNRAFREQPLESAGGETRPVQLQIVGPKLLGDDEHDQVSAAEKPPREESQTTGIPPTSKQPMMNRVSLAFVERSRILLGVYQEGHRFHGR